MVRQTGKTVDVVHVVGGGAQNELLCQLTADATNRPVLAGPVEATAIGNVLVQARAAGLVSGSLESLRSLVRRAFPPAEYAPRAPTHVSIVPFDNATSRRQHFQPRQCLRGNHI